MTAESTADLCSRLLDVVETDIVPLTRPGVENGNKLFGAAVLRKADWSLVVAGTNRETENPLWHGEMATIKALYELPATARPDSRDCIFLSTHEPCSMCLSAITWAGYDNFYYLFSYEDSRDAFHIPHDLRIMQEVFGCAGGEYARENSFWKAGDIVRMIHRCPAGVRARLIAKQQRLTKIYGELSHIYQASKAGNAIPLN